MNYTSEDFRIQYVSTYTLYVNTDYIVDQLVVVDEDNHVMAFMSYECARPSQDAMKMLSLPFQSVYVTLPHQNLIWVPAEIFKNEGLDAFISFFDHAEPSRIFSKSIDTLGVTALYEFDALQANRWRNIFEEAKFIPVFEVILNQALPQIPIQGKVLGVHSYNSKVDLFVFVDGSFRFYNSFEVATIDDLSYFVLQLFKNFGIEKKIEKIILSGADLQSEWATCLSVYTDDLELVKSKNTWLSSSTEVVVQTSTLNVLIDSTLCE